jgi:hypothetical protein
MEVDDIEIQSLTSTIDPQANQSMCHLSETKTDISESEIKPSKYNILEPIPKELMTVSFLNFNKDNIFTMKKLEIPLLGCSMIPCLYKYGCGTKDILGSFNIKGCEMYSPGGVRKTGTHKFHSVGGVIVNDIDDNKIFKSIIDECVEVLATKTNTKIKSPLVPSGETHKILFYLSSINNKTPNSTNYECSKFTHFHDSDRNLIPWENITNVPFRFIPTFCVTHVYLSPSVNTLKIKLIEATITYIDPQFISPSFNDNKLLKFSSKDDIPIFEASFTNINPQFRISSPRHFNSENKIVPMYPHVRPNIPYQTPCTIL